MADEGSSRKRRNREFEKVPLGTTLNDHVSNGDCAEVQALEKKLKESTDETNGCEHTAASLAGALVFLSYNYI